MQPVKCRCPLCGHEGEMPAVAWVGDDLYVKGKRVHLTRSLVEMMRVLLRHAGNVSTKQMFWHALYGGRSDGGPDPKVIDVMVLKLRQALKKGGAPFEIETVWGRGYRLLIKS